MLSRWFSMRYFLLAFLVLPANLLLSAGLGAEDVSPADWPQFKRDAPRSGDNPWARLTFPLRRITAIRFPAPIYASPAVVGGRVFIQDAQGHLACIDAALNRVVWKASLGGINNSSSPAVAAGRVFVGSTTGKLHILDASTGAMLHEVPAGGPVIAAPAITPRGIYFSTLNGRLHKVSPDGRLIWTYDGGRLSSVELAAREDRIVFFAGSDNTIFHELQDAGDEVKVLRTTPAANQCCPVGGPALLGEQEFVFQSFDSEVGRFNRAGGESKPTFLTDLHEGRVVPSVRGKRIYRGDKCFTGSNLGLVWRAERDSLYDGGCHSSPALAAEHLAVGSELGKVYFFTLEGKGRLQPVWEYAISTAGQPNGAVSSSPAVVSDQVFFGGEDGILYGLQSATAEPTERAASEAPIVEAVFTHEEQPRIALAGSAWPTVGGDRGFSGVSDDRTLQPPFRLAWQTRVWSAFKCPLIVAEGQVFCTGRGGTLTALDAARGEIVWKTHHPGVESRPPVTYADGKLVVMRTRNGQGDSPYSSGGSGGPPGEGLWCHDAATGRLLWQVPMAFKYHFNHDGLVVHEGLVFIVRHDDNQQPIAVAHALDDGREVWRRPLEEHLGEFKPPVKTSAVRPGPGLPPRFSGVLAGDLWCVSICDRGTLALRTADGSVVWTNKDHAITNRTRLAARRGVVMVYTATAGQALDAKTGQPLWTDAVGKTSYTQALSDAYLDSQGKQGIFPGQHCSWPVHINGLIYSHERKQGSNQLQVFDAASLKKVWSHMFLSNACPSPSPAYGRLYYSPNAEGVVYCFESESPAAEPPAQKAE